MPIDWEMAVTLAVGSATTMAGGWMHGRADRQRLIAQRSADIEGEALLKLQGLLGELPDAYYGILRHMEELVEDPGIEHGQWEDHEISKYVYDAAAPRREVEVLATRIVDDRVRRTVIDALHVIWPASTEELTAASVAVLDETPDRHPFPFTPPDDVDRAIREAVEDIGARLRGTTMARWRRSRRK